MSRASARLLEDDEPPEEDGGPPAKQAPCSPAFLSGVFVVALVVLTFFIAGVWPQPGSADNPALPSGIPLPPKAKAEVRASGAHATPRHRTRGQQQFWQNLERDGAAHHAGRAAINTAEGDGLQAVHSDGDGAGHGRQQQRRAATAEAVKGDNIRESQTDPTSMFDMSTP